MSCRDRWIDAFVTKGDIEYEYDDKFVCTVQSVDLDILDADSTGKLGKRASIVAYDTDFIMPTWTMDLGFNQDNLTNLNITPAIDPDQWNSDKNRFYSRQQEVAKRLQALKVGDLIRIGGPENNLATNYLTIMEIIKVDELYNGIASVQEDTRLSLIHISEPTRPY